MSNKMGEGASCFVVKGAIDGDATAYAIKVMRKNRTIYKQMYEAEKDMLQKLDHPNIIKFVEADDKNPKNFYIITKLATGGELFDRIVDDRYKMTEKKVSRIVRQMLDALSYIQSLDIVHRDLKPENFLFENPSADAKLILIDFGTAVVCKDDEERTDLVGTPFYLAPESASNKASRTGRMLKSSDLWAVGVIAYICMTGCPPFHGDTNRAICHAIVKKPLKFPSMQLSNQFKNFCKQAMQKRWKKRITVQDALSHPWVIGDALSENSLGIDAIRSLRQFGSQMKIKKEVSKILAANMGDVPKKKVKEHFDSLDTDGSGTLTLDEVTELMKKLGYGEITAEAEAKEMMSSVDDNLDGSITFDEFSQVWQRKLLSVNHAYIEAVFKVLDSDQNGYITAEELGGVLKEMGEEEIATMIAECDRDKDGQINLKEFKLAMTENIKSKKVKPSRMAHRKVAADDLAEHTDDN